VSAAQRLSTTALVAILAVTGLSSAAAAHGDHHHHSRKKKKAYNRGYRHGYRRAIESSYRPPYRTYYRIYSPVYGLMVSPVPQRVIVAPAPWIIPVHPHRQGTRVNVGLGFNL
jgi:hypothetical protein